MSRNGRPVPDSRPAASLTSNLLARRGDARPAMRRPSINGHQVLLSPHDDLGWNDIGEDHDASGIPATSLAAMTPPVPAVPEVSAVSDRRAADVPDVATNADLESEIAAGAAQSPVTRQLEVIARRIALPPLKRSFKPIAARKTKGRADQDADGAGRKAAFTLRIDPERHLRLRLLSAVSRRSAQQLLIEALDTLLAQHGDLEDIAGRVEATSDRNSTEVSLKKQA